MPVLVRDSGSIPLAGLMPGKGSDKRDKLERMF